MTSKAARKDKKPREDRGCTPEIVAEIVEALENGIPLAVFCRQDGKPGLRTVYTWRDNNPEFKKRLDRARKIGHEVIAARLRDIASGKKGVSSGDVQRDKLMIYTDLQLLAKWDPSTWGERQEIDHKSSDGSMSPKPTVVRLVPGTGKE